MMEKGARRIVPVAVSGPFHTSLMKPAGDKLAERFKTEHFGEMKFPVLFNATGKELAADTSLKEVRFFLEELLVTVQSISVHLQLQSREQDT